MDNIQDKLQSLVNLQVIDSKLDRLRQIRGGLPEEVRHLEDELESLKTKMERYQAGIDEANKQINKREITIQESEDLIKKYEAQLMDVKNNREYEALNKEIELARLEILTCERKIKQFREMIEEEEARLSELKALYDERQGDLEAKQTELQEIVAETEREEEILKQKSEEARKEVDQKMLRSYERIRQNVRNGLAVVTLDRGASGGSHFLVPPQVQNEVRQKNKVIISESCGRFLVDESFFQQAQQAGIAATGE